MAKTISRVTTNNYVPTSTTINGGGGGSQARARVNNFGDDHLYRRTTDDERDGAFVNNGEMKRTDAKYLRVVSHHTAPVSVRYVARGNGIRRLLRDRRDGKKTPRIPINARPDGTFKNDSDHAREYTRDITIIFFGRRREYSATNARLQVRMERGGERRPLQATAYVSKIVRHACNEADRKLTAATTAPATIRVVCRCVREIRRNDTTRRGPNERKIIVIIIINNKNVIT